MERRTFIRYVGTLGTAAVFMPELLGCSEKRKHIAVSRIGANFQRGHLLRNLDTFRSKAPSVTIETGTLIVGGGISGLSTAYHLLAGGSDNFLLAEMNERTGGNSGSSENEYSKFPLGAHYLSLPNPKNRPLIDFLQKTGLIEGEENGKHIFNERHLCHAPDERLLFRGVFSEGLIPEYGVSPEVHAEIKRFFALMKSYRTAKDDLGNDLFHIPLSYAGHSEFLSELDNRTFADFLEEHAFHSQELQWFLDYCCRDDYGAGLDKVSAWSGIHYFAARKAEPANTDPVSVLTWPEGNGWLANKLSETVANRKTSLLVFNVEEKNDGVESLAYDFGRDEVIKIVSKNAVMACPSYVSKAILKSGNWPESTFAGQVHHPWLTGIVVLDKIPATEGTPLAWDNVKYGTKGLGYVDNRHQELRHFSGGKHVISVYHAFDRLGDAEERRRLFAASDDELLRIVTGELESMHPGISKDIISVTFQLWGHGMITPVPGTYAKYRQFRETDDEKSRIHIAHTDFSGYSVFEEAFDLGFRTAQKLLRL